MSGLLHASLQQCLAEGCAQVILQQNSLYRILNCEPESSEGVH